MTPFIYVEPYQYFYKIVSCGTNTDEITALGQGSQVIYLSSTEVYNFIDESLKKGEVLVIPKDITNITIKDILVSKNFVKVFDAVKYSLRTKFKDIVINRLGKIGMMEILDYMIVTMKLMDKQIIITDQNREDKYIEILNSESAEDISLLEEYLAIYDKMRIYYALYKYYKKFEEDIDNTTTIEEAEQVYNLYVDNIENPTKIPTQVQ
jgi:hypothetical protein